MDLLDKRIAQAYKYNVKDVLEALKTSKHGLSTHEAKRRLETFGPNLIEAKKKVTPLKIFLYQFKDVMVAMLIIATAISFLIHEVLDAVVILIILVLNTILGFLQEYKAEKAMEALQSLAAPKALVIRNGKEVYIQSKDLVPGDIVVLNTGDRVPANIRLVKAVNLKVDQSHLTGESVPVVKTSEKIEKDVALADRHNIVYMGSLISCGRGLGVVVATGARTEIGKIAKSVQEQERETTPLQKEIANLGKWLSIIVVLATSMLFFLGILFKKDITFMFLTAVSLAVSAVPEGLPAVITVTLALGMQRMAKNNAIVRKLSAVQTLGNVTVICTDKTGTLTKNEMTVTKIYDSVNEYNVTGTGYKPEGVFKLNGKIVNIKNKPNLIMLLKTGVLCNTAYFGKDGDVWNVVGDPTEGSLLVLAAKAGIWHENLKNAYKEIHEFTFNSERKRMSVVCESKQGVFVFSKGAPDIMLDLCDKILINGKIKPLSKKMRKKILEKNAEWASNALRVLALAFKELPQKNQEFKEEKKKKNLVFKQELTLK